MCGLTGFYTLKRDRSRSELHVIGKAMTDALSHRGPDRGDLWQDSDIPLLLGHRRLSILDLSPEGAQPMTSASGRYLIVFNGEIYNHLELRRDLGSSEITYRGRSDTETLLTAIEHWGLNTAIQKINGMFAFVLWDKQTRQLHFIRDRLGKKPLYVGWAGDTLVFGSELKALRAHPDFKPSVNRAALATMVSYGYCKAPYTIYDGVWHLPAGQRFSIDTERLEAGSDLRREMVPYWDAVRVMEEARLRPTERSEEQILEEFESLLSTCISDRLISDVPLGAFLSGGIDSSTVVALMQKLSDSAIKTYSIGFKEAGFDEAVYARKIAEHLGTDHHEMYVSASDALGVIPKLADIYDEPFGDISSIPTYLVSQFARNDVTVALSGDGGDEMLGGYSRHIETPKIWGACGRMPKAVRQALAGGIGLISPKVWDKINPSHPQFGRKLHKAAGVLSMDSQEAVYDSLLQSWHESPVIGGHELHTEIPALKNLSFAEKMMVWDAASYLPNDILTKVDRASMAVSLEARAPLLDKRIYEYVWRLPADMKIRNGRGKYLLRQVLSRYVPDAMFERPKQGFTMPVGEWLRGDLREWGEALLDEQVLRDDGLFDVQGVRARWDALQSGRGNYAQGLWHVLMFQAWHQRWMKV